MATRPYISFFTEFDGPAHSNKVQAEEREIAQPSKAHPPIKTISEGSSRLTETSSLREFTLKGSYLRVKKKHMNPTPFKTRTLKTQMIQPVCAPKAACKGWNIVLRQHIGYLTTPITFRPKISPKPLISNARPQVHTEGPPEENKLKYRLKRVRQESATLAWRQPLKNLPNYDALSTTAEVSPEAQRDDPFETIIAKHPRRILLTGTTPRPPTMQLVVYHKESTEHPNTQSINPFDDPPG